MRHILRFTDGKVPTKFNYLIKLLHPHGHAGEVGFIEIAPFTFEVVRRDGSLKQILMVPPTDFWE